MNQDQVASLLTVLDESGTSKRPHYLARRQDGSLAMNQAMAETGTVTLP